MILSLAVTAFAWFLGSFVVIITGMGGGLLAIPIMIFFVDLKTMVVVGCIAGFLCCLPLAWRFWQHVDWRRNWLLVLGCIPGAFAGVLTLRFASTFWLQVGIGLMMLAYSLWQALNTGARGRWTDTAPRLFGCGAASGYLIGAVGVGGPPIAFYAYKTGWDKDMARGLFGVFFIICNAVTVAMDFWYGLVTMDVLQHVGVTVPAMALGTLAGLPAAKKLPQKVFEVFMLAVVGLAGAALLFKAAYARFFI